MPACISTSFHNYFFNSWLLTLSPFFIIPIISKSELISCKIHAWSSRDGMQELKMGFGPANWLERKMNPCDSQSCFLLNHRVRGMKIQARNFEIQNLKEEHRLLIKISTVVASATGTLAFGLASKRARHCCWQFELFHLPADCPFDVDNNEVNVTSACSLL